MKAIVFDCYGVLTTDAWLPFKTKHFGDDTALFDEATELNRQANAGYISRTEFLQQIAALAKLPFEDVRVLLHRNVPNEDLFDFIVELKQSYKIGMLSNVGGNWLPQLFSDEQIALFDALALSHETGMIKPELRAYEIIAERLDVQPQDCVFIDDQERFCTAARDAGMQAVWYQDVATCKAAVRAILADSKD